MTMEGKIFYLTLLVCIAWAVMAQPESRFISGDKGCYVKEMNRIIPVGAVVTPPGHCMSVECSERLLNYTLCGEAKNKDPNCHITPYDLTKSFPDCCPIIKCIFKVNV